jgi:hypothetical protein
MQPVELADTDRTAQRHGVSKHVEQAGRKRANYFTAEGLRISVKVATYFGIILPLISEISCHPIPNPT